MLNVINISESEKWDTIVKSFINYDIYYLSGYTKAFKVHGDGEPILFYYKDDDIKAINVVMKRDIADDRKFNGIIETQFLFDTTTPYGYGGFIVEGEINENSLNRLDEVYSDYCISNNIICEFVRFHPLLGNTDTMRNAYSVINLGKTITIDLLSQEHIWKTMSSKNRNIIRKAIKSGVEIYWGRSPELFNKFIPLYNSTMEKDNATAYYYFSKDFFQSVLKDLKFNCLMFYALYNNKIISMAMILFGGKNMHYHLSASDREHQSLGATNLLLYEAACWGCENGYKTFHLGGGLGSREDSLYMFKRAFNKESTTYFSVGKKIFIQEKYDYLLSLRNISDEEIDRIDFFPQYRGLL